MLRGLFKKKKEKKCEEKVHLYTKDGLLIAIASNLPSTQEQINTIPQENIYTACCMALNNDNPTALEQLLEHPNFTLIEKIRLLSPLSTKGLTPLITKVLSFVKSEGLKKLSPVDKKLVEDTIFHVFLSALKYKDIYLIKLLLEQVNHILVVSNLLMTESLTCEQKVQLLLYLSQDSSSLSILNKLLSPSQKTNTEKMTKETRKKVKDIIRSAFFSANKCGYPILLITLLDNATHLLKLPHLEAGLIESGSQLKQHPESEGYALNIITLLDLIKPGLENESYENKPSVEKIFLLAANYVEAALKTSLSLSQRLILLLPSAMKGFDQIINDILSTLEPALIEKWDNDSKSFLEDIIQSAFMQAIFFGHHKCVENFLATDYLTLDHLCAGLGHAIGKKDFFVIETLLNTFSNLVLTELPQDEVEKIIQKAFSDVTDQIVTVFFPEKLPLDQKATFLLPLCGQCTSKNTRQVKGILSTLDLTTFLSLNQSQQLNIYRSLHYAALQAIKITTSDDTRLIRNLMAKITEFSLLESLNHIGIEAVNKNDHIIIKMVIESINQLRENNPTCCLETTKIVREIFLSAVKTGSPETIHIFMEQASHILCIEDLEKAVPIAASRIDKEEESAAAFTDLLGVIRLVSTPRTLQSSSPAVSPKSPSSSYLCEIKSASGSNIKRNISLLEDKTVKLRGILTSTELEKTNHLLLMLPQNVDTLSADKKNETYHKFNQDVSLVNKFFALATPTIIEKLTEEEKKKAQHLAEAFFLKAIEVGNLELVKTFSKEGALQLLLVSFWEAGLSIALQKEFNEIFETLLQDVKEEHLPFIRQLIKQFLLDRIHHGHITAINIIVKVATAHSFLNYQDFQSVYYSILHTDNKVSSTTIFELLQIIRAHLAIRYSPQDLTLYQRSLYEMTTSVDKTANKNQPPLSSIPKHSTFDTESLFQQSTSETTKNLAPNKKNEIYACIRLAFLQAIEEENKKQIEAFFNQKLHLLILSAWEDGLVFALKKGNIPIIKSILNFLEGVNEDKYKIPIRNFILKILFEAGKFGMKRTFEIIADNSPLLGGQDFELARIMLIHIDDSVKFPETIELFKVINANENRYSSVTNLNISSLSLNYLKKPISPLPDIPSKVPTNLDNALKDLMPKLINNETTPQEVLSIITLDVMNHLNLNQKKIIYDFMGSAFLHAIRCRNIMQVTVFFNEENSHLILLSYWKNGFIVAIQNNHFDIINLLLDFFRPIISLKVQYQQHIRTFIHRVFLYIVEFSTLEPLVAALAKNAPDLITDSILQEAYTRAMAISNFAIQGTNFKNLKHILSALQDKTPQFRFNANDEDDQTDNLSPQFLAKYHSQIKEPNRPVSSGTKKNPLVIDFKKMTV